MSPASRARARGSAAGVRSISLDPEIIGAEAADARGRRSDAAEPLSLLLREEPGQPDGRGERAEPLENGPVERHDRRAVGDARGPEEREDALLDTGIAGVRETALDLEEQPDRAGRISASTSESRGTGSPEVPRR